MKKLYPYILLSVLILFAFFTWRQTSIHGYAVSSLNQTLESQQQEVNMLKQELEKKEELSQAVQTQLIEAERKQQFDRLTRIDSPIQEYFNIVRKNYDEKPWWKDSAMYEKQAQFAAQIAANAAGSVFWKKEEGLYSSKTSQNSYVIQSDRLDAILRFAGINKTQSDSEKLSKILELLGNIKYEEDLNNEFRFPLETLNLRSGDCDDFSILAAALLKRVGIKSAIVLVSNNDRTDAHAWIAVQGNYNLEPYSLSSFGLPGKWHIVEPQFHLDRQSKEWFERWPTILAVAVVP